MRTVFISSVVQDFEPFRAAAKEACELLSDRPVMCELFGARPYSSEIACTTEVEQSDVYVVLLGERFGFEPTPGKSVTQQEFERAVALHKPILVFIQRGDKEPKQQAFQRQVENYSAGFFRDEFTDSNSLTKAIVRGLNQLRQARDASPEPEFMQRISDALVAAQIAPQRQQHEPSLVFAHWPQPRRRVALRDDKKDFNRLFIELCDVELCELSNGFTSATGAAHRSLSSAPVQYASFDDGCEVLVVRLENPRSNEFGGFSFMFIDPALVKRVAHGAVRRLAGSAGWYSLELQQMENRWFGDPGRSSSGGMTVAQHASTSHALRDLLIPAPAERLTSWADDALQRFARVFSQKRRG